MSDDVRDRLIDHALRELHRGAPAVELGSDLAAAIAERLARGERGVALDEIEIELSRLPETREGAPLARDGRAKQRAWLALAAAATLALGGAALWWFARERSARPLVLEPVLMARSQAPVMVYRGAERRPLESNEIQLGDAVAVGSVGARGSVRFDLVSGGALTVREGSVFETRPRPEGTSAFALLRGGFEFASEGELLLLDAGFAELEAVDHAHFSIELLFAGETPLANAPADAALLARLANPTGLARLLRLSVAEGELAVHHRGGREILVAGGRRELWSVAELGALATAEGAAKARALLEECLWPGPPGSVDLRGQVMAEARGLLGAFLAEEPQYWSSLRAEIVQRLGRFELDELGFARLLDFLLDEPSGTGFALARELWLLFPQGFTDFHVAVLAERGAFEFLREASALVAAGDRAWTKGPILCATLLARRGDHEAIAFLRHVLARASEPVEPSAEPFWDALCLALAGDALALADGESAYDRVVELLVRGVGTSLDRGRLYEGLSTLAALGFVDEARRRGERIALGSLLDSMGRLFEEGDWTVADVAAARERLEAFLRSR